MNFPTIAEPEEVKEQILSPIYKTEFDAPYVAVRKQWTAPSKTITFVWGTKVALPERDYQILENFFIRAQTSAFNITHPLTRRIYEVMFMQDGLDFNFFCPGYRSGQLQFRTTGIYTTVTSTTTTTTTD